MIIIIGNMFQMSPYVSPAPGGNVRKPGRTSVEDDLSQAVSGHLGGTALMAVEPAV